MSDVFTPRHCWRQRGRLRQRRPRRCRPRPRRLRPMDRRRVDSPIHPRSIAGTEIDTIDLYDEAGHLAHDNVRGIRLHSDRIARLVIGDHSKPQRRHLRHAITVSVSRPDLKGMIAERRAYRQPKRRLKTPRSCGLCGRSEISCRIEVPQHQRQCRPRLGQSMPLAPTGSQPACNAHRLARLVDRAIRHHIRAVGALRPLLNGQPMT